MIQTLIADILETRARRSPDTPALINESKSLSYQHIYRLVSFWETRLQSLHLPDAACVGLRFSHQVEHLLCHLALLKLGITQTSLAPDESTAAQQKTALALGVDLIITDIPGSEPLFNCPVITARSELSDLQGKIQASPKKYPVNICLVFQGSGTTARPKLIALPSPVYANMVEAGLPYNNASLGEKYYCCSRIHYAFPGRMALLYLLKGATLVLPDERPADLLTFCNKENIKHILLTAHQASSFLLNSPQASPSEHLARDHYLLPELKSLTLSSSLIKENLRAAILQSITPNLFIHYGTNEFGLIAQAGPEEIRSTPGTVGHLVSPVELKLHPVTATAHMQGSVKASIAVRKDLMIHHYVDNREDTRRCFSPSGFFHPQDLGRLTPDGQLIVEGRSDDAMIFAGANIYPRPLEVVLEQHPCVSEAAVFPLASNNSGEIPVAVVTTIEPVSQHDLLDHCEQHLGWKRPQMIFFAKTFPRNTAGKVLKRVLVQQVQRQLSQTPQ